MAEQQDTTRRVLLAAAGAAGLGAMTMARGEAQEYKVTSKSK